MQAAIPQMAEYHNLNAGKRRLQSRRATFNKLGHPLARNGTIMFDAGAQIALRGRDIFTQGPSILPLRFRLCQHRIVKTVCHQKFGQQITQIITRHRIGEL